jgi:hypothetical protein
MSGFSVVVQQLRLAVAADDGVQAQSTDVDVAAGERVGEAGREVRRPGYRTGAGRGGRVAEATAGCTRPMTSTVLMARAAAAPMKAPRGNLRRA